MRARRLLLIFAGCSSICLVRLNYSRAFAGDSFDRLEDRQLWQGRLPHGEGTLPKEAGGDDVRVFVYQLPPEFNEDILNAYRCTSSMYTAEIHLHNAFLNHPSRTLDPEAARYFFVPVYLLCKIRPGDEWSPGPDLNFAKSTASRVVQYIRQRWPYWNRTRRGGEDHLFVVGHDYGACFEWRLDESDVLIEALRDTTLLQFFGVKSAHRCDPKGHRVIIPPFGGLSIDPPLEPGAPGDRRGELLASFAGTLQWAEWPMFHWGWEYSNELRNALRTYADVYSDFQINDGEVRDFKLQIRRSIFCLCPRGWVGWSQRMVQVIMEGCIPALIADNISLPFDSELHWSSFSVQVPEEEVHAGTLRDYLLAVPRDVVLAKQRRLRQVALFFSYDTQLMRNHMVPLILRELAELRRRGFDKEPAAPEEPERLRRRPPRCRAPNGRGYLLPFYLDRPPAEQLVSFAQSVLLSRRLDRLFIAAYIRDERITSEWGQSTVAGGWGPSRFRSLVPASSVLALHASLQGHSWIDLPVFKHVCDGLRAEVHKFLGAPELAIHRQANSAGYTVRSRWKASEYPWTQIVGSLRDFTFRDVKLHVHAAGPQEHLDMPLGALPSGADVPLLIVDNASSSSRWASDREVNGLISNFQWVPKIKDLASAFVRDRIGSESFVGLHWGRRPDALEEVAAAIRSLADSASERMGVLELPAVFVASDLLHRRDVETIGQQLGSRYRLRSIRAEPPPGIAIELLIWVEMEICMRASLFQGIGDAAWTRVVTAMRHEA